MSKKFRSVYPTEGKPESSPPGWAGRLHPLWWGVAVSAVAAAASLLMPVDHASTGVALCFLVATYALSLQRDAVASPEFFGLALGGLMNPAPLSPRKMIAQTGRALAIATGVALVILPLFWVGFLIWYEPKEAFETARAFTWEGESSATLWLGEMILWHVFAVALPEEAFYRGYLQSSLETRWRWGVNLFGVRFGTAIIVTSVLFALGHLATDPHPARLAVFFPSLLFGLTRTGSGGIGAAVFLHAECNLFSQWLGQGYGLY